MLSVSEILRVQYTVDVLSLFVDENREISVDVISAWMRLNVPMFKSDQLLQSLWWNNTTNPNPIFAPSKSESSTMDTL